MSLIDEARNGIVLDGAMSDELERQGVDTNSELWTGAALINQLDKVYQAHLNYFKAGAQLVITDTYQANVPAYEKIGYSADEAIIFIKNGVKIAQRARDDFERETGKHNYVAATIGSYGAYLADGNEYHGNYSLSEKEYLDFHLPRLQAVLDENPDLIALETQPKLDEPVAILDWLKENHPDVPVYVSFTLKNAIQISDGTSIQEAVTQIDKYQQVFAIGINCVNPKIVSAALTEINKYTDKPLVVYPNLGAVYDPAIKQWKEFEEKFDFSQLTKEWYDLGARLIGGCCTTGPAEIEQISQELDKLR